MICPRLFLITQILFNSLVFQYQPLRAPLMVSGSEIVAAVNVFRAQYGLPPYQLDGNLVSIGQTQAEYMASIKTLTHTRANGSGVTVSSENIAEGTAAEPADAIVRRWTADAPHTTTLIGFRTGLAGAGAAMGSDGLIYYALDVTNTGKTLTGLTLDSLPAGTASPAGGLLLTPAATLPPLPSWQTATPQADGSVIHTVQYGQTLSGIAKVYGLALNDLLALNPPLNANTVIQIGQRLLIRHAVTASPAPQTDTPAATSPPVEVSPSVTAAYLPTSDPTPLITPTKKAPPSGLFDNSSAPWITLGVAFLGLGLAFLGRFIKSKPPE